MVQEGFPGGSDGQESASTAGDPGLIPGSGEFPGEGNSNPLQYSCLGNSMDRGAWEATVHVFTKSWIPLRHYHLLFLVSAVEYMQTSVGQTRPSHASF